MSNYSKHKDRAPQDTIFEIQRILNEIGLFPVINNMENEFDGAHSNRVTLYPSKLGTNGKGTDELFATASGYAELIERIQNNLLTRVDQVPRIRNYNGFYHFHDEKEISLADVANQNTPYLENIFQRLGRVTFEEKVDLLSDFNQNFYHVTSDKIKTVPFVDITEKKLVYIPLCMVYAFCGSNGMAAGNTLEEAFVQAMSELFERHMNVKVLLGEAVPPEIPRKYLEKYSFWNLIEQIEKGGKYKVSVRDCSFGKNYPVTATMIVDKSRGTFGMKFGAHPSFAVSVERTLTEAFQGRRIESFTAMNVIGSEENITAYSNMPNVAKVGSGAYSHKLLSGIPDWEFSEWTYWQGVSNSEFFKKMLALVTSEGYKPLFRDSSHLGFPACHIVIPNFCEIFPMSELSMRDFRTSAMLYEPLNKFPELSAEDEKRFLRLIRFREYAAIDSGIDRLMRRPIKEGLMSGLRIGAFLALKHGMFNESVRMFKKFVSASQNDDERLYFECLTKYADLLYKNIERDNALKVIKNLFRDDIADRVIYEVENPEEMMRRVFPQMNCYDCENCALSDKYCDNLVEEKVFKKIKDALAKSTVSQENLLDYFNNL